MIIKRIGVVSCGRMSGTLYAAMGVIVGALVMLTTLTVLVFDLGQDIEPAFRLAGMLAVVWMPVCYGAIGSLVGLVTAALYNLAARLVGGLEVDLVERAARGAPPG